MNIIPVNCTETRLMSLADNMDQAATHFSQGGYDIFLQSLEEFQRELHMFMESGKTMGATDTRLSA